MGSTHGVAFNPSTGAAAPTKAPEVPPGLPWGKTETVAKSTAPGGSIAKVTYVGDGDGFKATFNDGTPVTCRINQIDAPEVKHDAYTTKNGKQFKASPDQAYGQESKKYLEDLILNKEVTVLVTKAEKDGRAYCEVELQGKSVALSTVQAGLAMVYGRYVSEDRKAELKGAESAAKAARKGLWADPAPISGESFRRQFN